MAEENSQKPTVLFVRPSSPSSYTASLSRRFHLIKSWDSPLPTHQFLALHSSARAMIVSTEIPTGSDILDILPNLKCLVTTSAGTDHIDLDECRRRGIQVAYAERVFSVDVADYAVGLLLDVMRKVSAGDRYVRNGLWPVHGEFPLGNKLGGKRVGIVGLGKIGSDIAKRLEAFGCIISYNSRQRKPWLGYPYFDNVHELATKSEILVICCALNDKTYHIINKDVMYALGKNGFIINVGRGPLINEKELVQCLMLGEIGGAGLDVFEDEPNVPEQLNNLDNVVLSPHKAVFTVDSFDDIGELIAVNLDAFFSGKPLLNPVPL